jgi:hypothetical protein
LTAYNSGVVAAAQELRDVAALIDPDALAAASRSDNHRVRVIVACSPHAAPELLAALARDSETAVRAAVAANPNTNGAIVADLMIDAAYPVRRRASRGTVPFDVLCQRLVSHRLTPQLQVRLIGELDDPAQAERLALFEPHSHAVDYYVLRHGRIGKQTIDRLVVRNPWAVIHLCENDRLPIAILRQHLKGKETQHRSRLSLAEVVARRTRWTQRGVVFEHPMVVAARLRQSPNLRMLKNAAFLRSRSACVMRELAVHPRTGRFGRWLVSRNDHSSVVARLATRTDLSGTIKSRLCSPKWMAIAVNAASNPTIETRYLRKLAASHRAVDLALLTNYRCPDSLVLQATRGELGPFLKSVALRHPSVGEATLRYAAQDLGQPAWILTSITRNPNCPEDLSDSILTWLAIGGAGDTDPLFDPLTEAGNPGSTKITRAVNIAEVAVQEGFSSALGCVRAAHAQRFRQLETDSLMALANDPAIVVRLRAAQFKLRRSLKDLIDDAEPSVAIQAQSVLRGLEPRAKHWMHRDVSRVFVMIVMLTLALPLIAFVANTSYRSAYNQPTTASQPVFSVPNTYPAFLDCSNDGFVVSLLPISNGLHYLEITAGAKSGVVTVKIGVGPSLPIELRDRELPAQVAIPRETTDVLVSVAGEGFSGGASLVLIGDGFKGVCL